MDLISTFEGNRMTPTEAAQHFASHYWPDGPRVACSLVGAWDLTDPGRTHQYHGEFRIKDGSGMFGYKLDGPDASGIWKIHRFPLNP